MNSFINVTPKMLQGLKSENTQDIELINEIDLLIDFQLQNDALSVFLGLKCKNKYGQKLLHFLESNNISRIIPLF